MDFFVGGRFLELPVVAVVQRVVSKRAHAIQLVQRMMPMVALNPTIFSPLHEYLVFFVCLHISHLESVAEIE